MRDEAPVVAGIPLCATCGGAGVDDEGADCPACEGYGMTLITDDAPDDEGPDDGTGP